MKSIFGANERPTILTRDERRNASTESVRHGATGAIYSGNCLSRYRSEVAIGTEKPHQDRTIDYIEFNVADIARSKSFYGKAFGWQFTDFGPDYCEFSDGHMKGGFNATGPVTAGGVLVILYGADLAESQSRIEEAGGKIVKPIFEFPGGRRFHFTDPDGYELAVWTEA